MAFMIGYLNLFVAFWEILTLMENWFYKFEVVRGDI